MAEERTPDGVGYRVTKVMCHRVGRQLSIDEHAKCPYCDGDPKHIKTAKHESFCDFKPGEDPINFGFPPDKGHYES
jgi:hypothetical protein